MSVVLNNSFKKPVEQEFADLLYSFVLAGENVNKDELPRAFAKIVSQRDVYLYQKQSLNRGFGLEVKLWDLVSLLAEFRSSMDAKEGFKILSKKFNSNASFLEEFLNERSDLKEIWLIQSWLRSNLMVDDNLGPVESGKWINTKLALQEDNVANVFGNKGKKQVGIVENLDYDAEIRENKQLESQDSNNDDIFYQRLYWLVLTRQDAEALELCEKTNNWTYYMILQGLNEYFDPLIDGGNASEAPQGIKNKYEWRRGCLRLSASAKNQYLKALFEFLGGGVEFNLALNKNNWDVALLVYLNAFLVSKMEQYLVDNGNLTDTEPLYMAELSGVDGINDILIRLALLLPEESENNYRLLMGAVMLNNTDEIIDSFLNEEYNRNILQATNSIVYSDLDDTFTDLTSDSDIVFDDNDYEESPQELEQILADDPHYDNTNSYLLRVMVHLSIYQKLVASSTTNHVTPLIELYLKRLFKKGLYSLIPIYVKCLPLGTAEDLAVQHRIYSYYLAKLVLKQNKLDQIRTCQNLDLDIKQVLIDTVDLIVTKHTNYYATFINQNLHHVNMVSDISDIDTTFYTSVDYLLNFPNLNHVAVSYLCKIFTNLLLSGKIRAVLELVKMYSFNDIIKKADVEVEIFSAKQDDTESITSSDSTESYEHDYRTNRKHLQNFLTVVNYGFSILDQYELYLLANNIDLNKANSKDNVDNRWKHQLIKEDMETKFVHPLNNLIVSQLVSLTINDNEDINEHFRKLYVPFFIISLHKIYVNSRFCDLPDTKTKKDSFLRNALDLSIQVAKSSNNFVKYFLQANKLCEYLTLVAEASAIAGEAVMYD